MVFDDHDVHDDWNTSLRLGARHPRARAGGTTASSAASCPTGSTSTWATSRPSTSPRTTSTAQVRGRERGRPAAARVRLPRRPRGGRHALELLPRLRRLAADHDRLARRPRARPGRGARCSTRRSGAGSRSTPQGEFDHLLIGSSLPLLLAPGLHYLEAWNEAVCEGAWGRARRARGGEVPPGDGPGALGGVRALAASARSRSSAAVGGRAARPAAGLDRRAVGRRPPRLPRRGRVQARRRRALRRLPGDLLAVPQPARRARAPGHPLRLLARGHGWSAGAGARGAASRTRRCAGASRTTTPWFDNQVCFLELDGRRVAPVAAEDGAGRGRRPRLETVFEHELAAG